MSDERTSVLEEPSMIAGVAGAQAAPHPSMSGVAVRLAVGRQLALELDPLLCGRRPHARS